MGLIARQTGAHVARARTNFGARPAGWRKISADVPDRLFDAVTTARDDLPGASLKLLMTAALGLYVGLPASAREAIYRWAHSKELSPDELDPREAALLLMALLPTYLREVPPAERSPGEEGERAGPPSGAMPMQSGGVLRVHMPPVQRPGYVERVIKTYEIVDPDQQQEREAKKGG